MGRWGLHEFIEPKLRPLVAEHLGVSVTQLVSQVSLREDLGADSLDLVELALLLETRFGITLSDRLLDDVRSYGDLVDVTVGLLLKRAADQRLPAELSPSVWARLLRSEEHAGDTLEHVGVLTPYLTETVIEHARLAGPGAHLEVGLAPGAPDGVFAQVNRRFAALAGLDLPLTVTIRRDDRTIAVDAADRDPRSTPVARRHSLAASWKAVWLPTDRAERWPPAA